MKQDTRPTLLNLSNRRTFLSGLGILGLGSMCPRASAAAASARYANRFHLFLEAPINDFSLIWPAPQLPPLPPTSTVRGRAQFPINGQDILEWHTLVDVARGQSLVVTLLHMRVDKISLSATPAPNFALLGRIIDNPVVDNPNHSPFGDLTGRIGMISAEFDKPGDTTTFTLLGVAAAGSHSSGARTAVGSLVIQGPWDSF